MTQAILLIRGLPGSGKSTLARALDKPGGNTLLSRQAMDYLKRHGLNAEITR